ncbi:MAG: hypothetical protein COC19_02460 [SAR86 cluster bacterium]|uniref:Secreted protein n=1 Tax=SAR86 cluster bacterium TaxID=2030880 RepID=A0A2A4MS03_9GAMM|nr:MAG: hypothetical protein COC19_02460 [SAR86 cluster bacterium]
MKLACVNIKLVMMFAICMFSTFALAQSQEENPDGVDVNSIPPANATDVAEEEIENTSEEITEEEEEEESNSRFIPTEQISRDLGVSFPVDI